MYRAHCKARKSRLCPSTINEKLSGTETSPKIFRTISFRNGGFSLHVQLLLRFLVESDVHFSSRIHWGPNVLTQEFLLEESLILLFPSHKDITEILVLWISLNQRCFTPPPRPPPPSFGVDSRNRLENTLLGQDYFKY